MLNTQESLTIYAANAAETQAIAQALANCLSADTILLLEGNLGSGKTTFVQGLGKGLGIQSAITSPTFTLVDEYHEGRLPLYHIDLYRLDTAQVHGLYLQEYWRGIDFPLGVVAIEWSERLGVTLSDYLKIELSISSTIPDPDNTITDVVIDTIDEIRQIRFMAVGDRHIKILNEFMNLGSFFFKDKELEDVRITN